MIKSSNKEIRTRGRYRHIGRIRRGSYFFVLDAFVAVAILAFAITLIVSFFSSQRQTEQTFSYAQDYLSFLTSSHINDYQNPVISELLASGNISDPRVTIAEQILRFHNRSDDIDAWKILNATAGSIPENNGIKVMLHEASSGYNTTLYNRTSILITNSTHLVASGIVYTLINNTLFGPFTLRVEVWS